MMILLVQLDGKIPNLALMRIAAHYRAAGDEVTLRRWFRLEQIQPELYDRWDRVYASAIFSKSLPLVVRLCQQYPQAIVGGTGTLSNLNLEQLGIGLEQDYSIYPHERRSLGFTQRGCRLKCPFCVVPGKEGHVRQEQTIAEIWRGDPWPKELLLLDNDFFGQPNWRDRIDEIRAGRFKVSFNQGINVRMIGDEEAAALASVDYRDDSMQIKRIYTAWDNRKDETRLFRGLELLVKYGIKPDQMMVYMLIGYWRAETDQDREYRRIRLREFGCRPYPMPYVRTPELIGFQRWIIGAYDKTIPWLEWKEARFQPARLTRQCP